jgi:hypothetical protein
MRSGTRRGEGKMAPKQDARAARPWVRPVISVCSRSMLVALGSMGRGAHAGGNLFSRSGRLAKYDDLHGLHSIAKAAQGYDESPRGFLRITTVASVIGSSSRTWPDRHDARNGQRRRRQRTRYASEGRHEPAFNRAFLLYSTIVSTRQEDANSRSTRRRVRPVLFSADHDTSVREA